jgi:predicted nuclease of predicted toxin-antitoxin system
VRILLDEAMAPGLAEVLTALGHPSDHVRDLGMAGASDEEVVERAHDYDVLLTLDLHRGEREWFAVHSAMLAGVKVIRLRFRRSEDSTLISQAQAVLRKWSEIEHLVMRRDDIGLIVLTRGGSSVRTRSVEAIQEDLRNRQT